MFVRFVGLSRHEDSHCLTGIFYTAWWLRVRGLLSEDDQALCDGILDWFSCHLPFPDRFSRSKRRNACGKAVCWFKDGADRHISKVRELVTLLGRHDVRVEMLWTDRPGYVVYEDRYQVAAVPFRDTRA